MKTTTAAFLEKQLYHSIKPGYKVEIFRQFAGAITDRDSATQIKVSGDATSLLSLGDHFIIAHANFETEYVITSAPSYASSKTTIVCSAASFTTAMVGLYVAKKYDVTHNVLDGGISPIRISTEGQSLNASLADDVKISLDNSDSTYYSVDGNSGIFNTTDYFWIRISFFLDNDPTYFIYFGGSIYPSSITPIDDLKNVEFMAHGHLKELERYPGWYVNDTSGKPIRITGLEMLSISGATYEGRKSLKYKFPDDNDINGLVIVSVSSDTPVGWHIIKNEYGGYFQYDYGAWTQLSAGATGQTLTSDKGHTIKIDVPQNLDIVIRQDLIYVDNFLAPAVQKFGRATLEFDGGKKETILFDFERVIRYDATGASYEDITRDICGYDTLQYAVFEAANDTIWIGSQKQFYGTSFQLSTSLVGSMEFKYSQGYDDWDTLSVTDGTSDFSQDGAITWNPPSDWRSCNQEINSVYYYNYFWVRIKLSSRTSGSASIKQMKRYFRLYGMDGTSLDLKCTVEDLPTESRDDEILLVEDSNGDMQPVTWKNMLSLHQYLTNLLDVAYYGSAYRSLDTVYISNDSEFIGMYGPPPKPFYSKKATAIVANPTSTPQILYIGIEDELWKCSEQSGWTFIGKLDLYEKLLPSVDYFKCKIVRLAIDGNGYINGIAVMEYEHDYDDGDAIEYRRAAIVFRSTNGTSITTQAQIDASDYPILVPGTRFFRMGDYVATDENLIGQDQAGENICIPYRQLVWSCNSNLNSVICDVSGGLTTLSYFGSAFYPPPMQKIYLSPGFYCTDDVVTSDGDIGNLGFTFTFGQNGLICWNETDDVWLFLRWDGTDWYLSTVNYTGSVTDYAALSGYNEQYASGIFSVADAKYYLAKMTWDEDGNSFPGDCSDCIIQSLTRTGGTFATLFNFASDSIESNQSLATADLPYCTIIEMVKNENEDTLHGYLLNRNDLTYHYFVYDIANDKLYSTQTGTGFTFQNNRQIKAVTYNSWDHLVYGVVIDQRYQEETAFLVSASFTAPGGSPDGTEITLTYLSNLKANEWDCIATAQGAGGRIYGLTGPNDCYLWQWDVSFYPQVFIADTQDDSFRTILDEIAELINMVHSINPDRIIYFMYRDSQKGAMTVTEVGHIIENSMESLVPWEHYYDGIEVKWKDPINGANGIERYGDFGFNRKVLTIDNYFIQYPQLAALIAQDYYNFFNSVRMIVKFRTIPLWQIDNRDQIMISHMGNFSFDPLTYWIISELELDPWGNELAITGIENGLYGGD